MAFPRMRLVRWFALLAAVGLLAAACGAVGDAADGPGETVPTTTTAEDETEDAVDAEAVFDRDACELLTDEQVAEVLGAGVTSESTPGDASIFQPASCTWSSADSTVDLTDPQATAITVFLGDRQIFDNTRVRAEGSQAFEELDGLGDEAYAGSGEGGVLVGAAGITVTPIGTDANDPANQDLVVDLLELLAANA